MADQQSTEIERLTRELAEARAQIAELQALESERGRAQEKLRRDQRLYTELFEDSLGLMCVHDLEGVLLIVNPAAAQSLGFRPEEGVGVNMKRFLAPPVRPLFDAYLERIRQHHSDSGLMRLMSRDGSERIWLYRNVLYEEPGAPPRVLGHAQDITERVRAEEALKESERRFRTLADTAPVLIWMCDPESNCVFLNQPWLDFCGRPLERELGQGWTECVHPEDRREALDTRLAAIVARQTFRIEYRMRRADGQYRWMLDTGTPRLDPKGRFTGYIGSCLDVTEARQHREALRVARDELALRVAERTAELSQKNEALRTEIEERKRVEEALRQSEQHYQVLAELSPVGIFHTDQHGRCLYVNQRTCRILGIAIEEIRKGGWETALHPEDREQVIKQWHSVLEGKPATSLEHRFLRPDGSTLWALTHFAAEKGPSGEITGCIGTVADITERKREEEESRKLEARVQHAQRWQSLGILAGGLAHDFNNLLAVILGNARMALMDIPAGSPVVEYLAEIESATSRAADLTSQMLAYAGKGQVILQAVDLAQLTAGMANLLQTIISKKAVIQYDLPSALPVITADAAQMRQVVINLITNASEALGEGGGIIKVSAGSLDADRTYLRSAYSDDHLPAGRYVYLEFSDSGCGMSPETQAKIFDPFFSTKFTGRGLGLAAVLGIVRAHHGTLKVFSRPGAGATFRILFPCSEKAAGRREPASLVVEAGRGCGTVLVIDDEPGLRHLARTILEKSGFTVLTAVDGGDAINVFREHSDEVDAVMLDMTMPVMSGEETLAELQRLRPDVPVLLCSGYSEREVVDRVVGQAHAGFLKKPYEPAELVETLQGALAGRVRGR